ncbi:FAD-dependent oxidoreductase [Chamaesiphon sp. VAR_69_metabat_338]|uniref:NAD(P)/FAD-dependent oxidoreductase n=1 Tax=Chamaesiphon sp. VAR_69_metabat_338 TaxID=2964704 RepID=UPI00286DB087|nr:FAD-dependent oxidoreductase [Chamaesiphon sp. VAR_69_metabat_338]
MTNPLEIAIVGAGMAGIVCARELQAAGQQGIAIFEKSRGVGGRLTTRRMFDTCVDRGTCYISPKGAEFQSLFDRLIAANIVEIWTDTTHTLTAAGEILADPDLYPRYVTPNGMNQIAKYLATDLDLRCGQRAISIVPDGNLWRLKLEGTESAEILTRQVILAIPAPQAVDLLAPLADILPGEFLAALKAVDFYPSIAIAAGYTPIQLAEWETAYPQVKAVTCTDDPILAWLGVDSSKRHQPAPPAFVLQSTAKFAAKYPHPEDTAAASLAMLERASDRFLPWFRESQWQQPHLWRYAFPKSPRVDDFLSIDLPAPLFCTGDWCRGRKVEDAYLAGLAVANAIRG